MQMISAIRTCHRLNVMHRDLKPENILVDLEGNLKLVTYRHIDIHTKIHAYIHTDEFANIVHECSRPTYSSSLILPLSG